MIRNTTSVRDVAWSLSAYVQTYGKEQTLSALKILMGRSVVKMWVFSPLTAMEHPFLTATIIPVSGKNLVNSRAAYGLRPVATEILRCSQGGGYVYSYSLIYFPDGTVSAVVYLSYVVPVDDTWFVGARMPSVPRYLPVVVEKRETVLRTVQSAADLVSLKRAGVHGCRS